MAEGADHDPKPRGAASKRGDRVQPLLDRHLDVKDDHVRVVVVQQLKSAGLVDCLRDPRRREPGALDEMSDKLAALGSGVDQEDAQAWSVFLSLHADRILQEGEAGWAASAVQLRGARPDQKSLRLQIAAAPPEASVEVRRLQRVIAEALERVIG